MRSSGNQREVRPSKRAREAAAAAHGAPPTPAPSAKKKRLSYANPHDSQDLDIYTESQIPTLTQVDAPYVVQQPPQVITSSPPLDSSPMPLAPPLTQLTQPEDEEDEENVEDGVEELDEVVLTSEHAEPHPLSGVDTARYCLKVKIKGKHGSGANAVTCEHAHTWQSVRTSKHTDGYRDMMLWCHERLVDDGGWRITRIECLVDYPGCKKDARYENDVAVGQYSPGWSNILCAVLAFWRDDLKAVRVNVVIHVKKNEAPAAPQASQAQGRRRTATAVQFEDLAVHLEDEAGRKDYSTNLRSNWICKVPACPYYPNFCYVKAEGDPLQNHYPLYNNIVTAWSKDIRDRLASAERPTVETVLMMKPAKYHTDLRKRNMPASAPTAAPILNWQPPSQPSSMPIMNFFLSGIIDPVSLTGVPGVQRGHPAEPRSSPSAMSDADRRMEQFFAWAAERVEWQGKERPQDLEKIKDLFDEQDYSLTAIERIDEESWVAMKLKRGQHQKMISCISKFRRHF
jgi:hypothetical protein